MRLFLDNSDYIKLQGGELGWGSVSTGAGADGVVFSSCDIEKER